MQHLTAFPLVRSRVHEVTGAGAFGFAAITAGGMAGDILWVRESWREGALHPPGLAAFLDPVRLILAEVRDQPQVLAVAEEGLRDGAISLAVLEVGRPLGLTQGRRLQLAAKAGRATGLCLIPEGMGSNAAETRWRAQPVFDAGRGADSTLQRWELIKNKSGTLGAWHVRWDHASHRLDLVSAAGERPGSQGMSG